MTADADGPGEAPQSVPAIVQNQLSWSGPASQQLPPLTSSRALGVDVPHPGPHPPTTSVAVSYPVTHETWAADWNTHNTSNSHGSASTLAVGPSTVGAIEVDAAAEGDIDGSQTVSNNGNNALEIYLQEQQSQLPLSKPIRSQWLRAILRGRAKPHVSRQSSFSNECPRLTMITSACGGFRAV